MTAEGEIHARTFSKMEISIMKMNVYLVLILIGVIVCIPSAEANENDFPNLSISATYIFSLDLDGNCELYTIVRIKNLDDDYIWKENQYLRIPIVITSFSEERPNVTSVTFLDSEVYYKVANYEVFPLEDHTYIHAYYIEFYPPTTGVFNKEKIATLRTINKFNGSSSKVKDYNKFILQSWILPKGIPTFKEYTDFIIRVNLPNDPYYWTEVLDTMPKYNYRSTFGRGESLEWWYSGTENRTDLILIDYRIHSDPLKQEIDRATQQSLNISEKSYNISVISKDISNKSYLISILAFGLGIIALRREIHIIVQILQNKMKK